MPENNLNDLNKRMTAINESLGNKLTAKEWADKIYAKFPKAVIIDSTKYYDPTLEKGQVINKGDALVAFKEPTVDGDYDSRHYDNEGLGVGFYGWDGVCTVDGDEYKIADTKPYKI